MFCIFRDSLRFVDYANARILSRPFVTAKSIKSMPKSGTPIGMEMPKPPKPLAITYIKTVAVLVSCIVGFRLLNTLFNRRDNESFASYFRSHAFSWPQHWNILLREDRLDVNDDDDEIT